MINENNNKNWESPDDERRILTISPRKHTDGFFSDFLSGISQWIDVNMAPKIHLLWLGQVRCCLRFPGGFSFQDTGWLGGCHDNYWSWDNHETMVGGNGIPYGSNRDMDHVGWFLNGDVPVPSANSTRESPLSIDKSS